MNSTSSFLQTLAFSGIGILLFAVSLLLGLWLYNIKSIQALKAYFLNAFLGAITLVCLYSFCCVGIKTVNLVAFLTLLWLIISNPSRFKWPGLGWKELLPALYIFPVVFIAFGYYTLPTSIENDVRYYAKIVYALSHIHQENFYHFYNDYDPSFHGVVPYHYTELWLASLVNTVFGVKSILALKYVTYPFIVSCICLGVVAGFQQQRRFITFVLFLALSAFPLYKLISFINTGWIVYTDFWFRPNFTIYYLSLLPLFYLLMEKRWKEFILFSAIVATTSVVIHPCLLAGVFCTLVVATWKKELSFKVSLSLFSILLGACVLMYLMYMVFSPHVEVLVGAPITQVIANSLKVWKAVLFITAAIIFECALFVGVSFLLNRLVIKRELSYVFIFILGQAVAGVILFQLLNQLDNSYQFPYTAYAATGFIVILSVMWAIDQVTKPAVFYGAALLLLAVGLFVTHFSLAPFRPAASLERVNLEKNHVSDDWIHHVSDYLSTHEQAQGGFVVGAADLEEFSPAVRNCLTIQVGSAICYLTDRCNLPSLTCSDTLLSDKTEKNAVAFEKAEIWIKAFPKYTRVCDFRDYLNSGQVDFVICREKVLPEDSSLAVYADKESDYRFITKKQTH